MSSLVVLLSGIRVTNALSFNTNPRHVHPFGWDNKDAILDVQEGEDSFANNPPNQVLAVMSEPVPLDVVVVLKEPVIEGDNLVYTVEVLDGPDSGEGKANALFIDVIGMPRGEVRQEVRQTARRVDRRI